MKVYQAKIVLEDGIVEMPQRATWVEALKDKIYLNKEYEGLYTEEAHIYTYEI